MSLLKRQYDEYVWGLKYRPPTLKDLILPERYLKQFALIIKQQQIPNMMFSGPAGCGKTSSAFLLADTIGMECLYLNISNDTGIDVLRTKINTFCSNVSIKGKKLKKLVIFDEADRASPNLQDGLKAAIETFSKVCTFIFITNHKSRMVPELIGRLQQLDFNFNAEETKDMKTTFYRSVVDILKKENVKFENKAIAHIVDKMFPDMRMVLTQLQAYSQQGDITLDLIGRNILVDLKEYFTTLSKQNFPNMRKFVMDLNVSGQFFFSEIFQNLETYVSKESLAEAIMIIAKYQFESSQVADQQIPLTACSIELMTCKFLV